MDTVLFTKSLVLGLAIAAPLGPIGALCIQRTLEKGLTAGIAGGLGTAMADALFASLAAIGFATFSGVLGTLDAPLRLVGGLFMLWLGIQSLRSSPGKPAAEVSTRDLLGTTAATFLLTLANPMTILAFAALFAGLGLAATNSAFDAVLVVGGVFAGSLLWWVLLSSGVSFARHRLPEAFAKWVARVSGAILIGFGIWALGTLGIRFI